jgi:hypothetical protein
MDERLKIYIEENIPFKELKDAGFFDKEIKGSDYDKIAERICIFFGLKSIYEYSEIMKQKDKWDKLSINREDLFEIGKMN